MTGETFSSSSIRLPSEVPLDFKNPGSRRLALGLLGLVIFDSLERNSLAEEDTKLALKLSLSSVFSSSHSLSDPVSDTVRISFGDAVKLFSATVTEVMGGSVRSPVSASSPWALHRDALKCLHVAAQEPVQMLK